MFKFKITPDRHNAVQKLNYCVLPHPAHFWLPSTFKKGGPQALGCLRLWKENGEGIKKEKEHKDGAEMCST